MNFVGYTCFLTRALADVLFYSQQVQERNSLDLTRLPKNEYFLCSCLRLLRPRHLAAR